MKKAIERRLAKETNDLRRKVMSDLKRLNPNLAIKSSQTNSMIYIDLDSNSKDKLVLPSYSYDTDFSSQAYITFCAKGEIFTVCFLL